MNDVPVVQRSRRRLAGIPAAVILVFTLSAGVIGCSSDGPGAPGGTGATATHGAMLSGQSHAESKLASAAWQARPDYVRRADQKTQAAYAYALERPEVIKWLPCYCGCEAIGHKNNLDCFVQPREQGSPIVYDEHGAYCWVCIDTALMAKQMIAQGKTLLQVRLAVDREFGAIAPGTPTELPPA
jgi:hypothetical protein